jgi:hypothetical protein
VKKTLVIIAVVMFLGAFAAAQVQFNQPSASAIINVNATIQQSASIVLDKTVINFDVTDPKVVTNGGDVVATGTVSMAKGHYAEFVIEGGELHGSKDGGTIADHIYVAAPAGGNPTPQQVNVGGLYYSLNYAASGVIGQKLLFPMTFTLAPVEGFVPDQYSGTVTITLYVV